MMESAEKNKNIFRLILKLFCIVAICYPAKNIAQTSQARFQRLNIGNGLSNNLVYNILQDSKGYLWAGVYDGLNRYDGYSFTHFQHNPSDSTSISNGPVTSVLEDRDKNIWIGTSTGKVCKLDPNTESFTPIKEFDSLSQKLKYSISSIIEDKTGNIWISTYGQGLFKYNTKENKATPFYTGRSLKLAMVTTVYPDLNNNLWIGTYTLGFLFYNAETDSIHTVLHEDFFNNPISISVQVQCIQRINSDWIMLGTKNGWAVFNTKNYTIKRYLFRPKLKAYEKNIEIYSITQDKSGYFWLASNNGIYKFNLKTEKIEHHPNNPYDHFSLSSNALKNVITDYSNNIWVASEEGINKLDAHRGKFYNYNANPEKNHKFIRKEVRTVYVDKGGVIWAGTEGGLHKITKDKTFIFKQDKKFTDEFYNKINTIYEDRSGNIWVGSPRGLQQLDKKTEKITHKLYPGQDSWAPYSTWAILEDDHNLLWFGTQTCGLYSYNPENASFINYGAKGNNKLSAEAIWSLFIDSKNNFWVGTNRGVFKRTRDKSTEEYTFKKVGKADGQNNQLSGENVWWFHEDKDKNIWIGTSDGGLNKLDPNTEIFTHFTTDEGIPSNTISAILEDTKGDFWISTVNGLCKFNPKTGKVIRNYHIEDGLSGNHFNFKSAFKTIKGEMLFGGKEGLIKFHPDSIEINSFEPHIVISSFKVLYNEARKELLKDSFISLPYNQNSFSFDFASLDLTNPEKNRFQYFLKGFDGGWIDAGTRHFVSYTNLDPGEYVFMLKGTNSDGMWSANEAAFRITILPPFWKTWWFRSLAAVILLSLAGTSLFMFYKRNVEKRKRVQSELAALRNQLNPHFVFNSLTSLQHFIIENQRNLALDYLAKFSVLMRMILENSKHAFITLEEEKKFLELYLFMEAARFEHKFGYKINIDPALNEHVDKIPPMLLQPVVENAIKHGLIAKKLDGKIDVSFIKKGKFIQCIVEDNGVGRKKASESKARSNIVHHSMSTEIINEKLELISSNKKNKCKLNYTDLFDIEGRPIGTRAEMEIPLPA